MTEDIFEHERDVTITKDEAPWAPKEELGEYKIKRWSWFDKQKALIESAIVIDAKKGEAFLDIAEYYSRLIKSTVTPPGESDWTLERIKELDPEIGTILRDHCREVNGLTWEEKRGFLKPSDQKKATPG